MLAPAPSQITEHRQRLRLDLRGVVQGVGFRPFVWQLARRFGLSGHVFNHAGGVTIEVEGDALGAFLDALRRDAPPLSRIDALEVEPLPLEHDEGFDILQSQQGGTTTRIGPDAALCEACREDISDPHSRFFNYPFTTCTHCGPRYSLTRRLPYDRANTGMAHFPLCKACERAYYDPSDRRFHAEVQACPDCGPRLSHGLDEAAKVLHEGGILALKGIGGYHLLCDAKNEAAVLRLRQRKAREAKPFAVVVADLGAAHLYAQLSAQEEALLTSSAAPIVIAKAKGDLAPSIAPNLNRIGLVLAYAPVHLLLLEACTRLSPDLDALVATSANVSGHPLIAKDDEALRDLGAIADLVVTHDRPIIMRCDDSVMQIIDGAPAFLRRARGFVPDPILLEREGPSIVAFGADMKNTICVTRGREAFLSQHIGGLDNAETLRFQRETLEHLCAILDVTPEQAVCDLHPDFRSTRLAESSGLPLLAVQHHHAHLAAVAGEHHVTEPALGLALDGHGYGPGGENWGGELLRLDGASFSRLGHLAPLALIGGDKAAREPWRMGLAGLHVAGRLDRAGELFPDRQAAQAVAAMLSQGHAFPVTSSMGRLFDAAASLSGASDVQAYEGHAAMEFEALVESPVALEDGFALVRETLDFAPLLRFLAEGQSPREAANLFHGTLIAGLSAWVIRTAQEQGLTTILLGGGCFHNRVLAEGLSIALRQAGLTPLLPRHAPAGDGGIALGQAIIAQHHLSEGV